MRKMEKKVLMKGNIAIALGAIDGGLAAYYGYPITPQNEIPEYMSQKLPELNKVFIQAESEFAAISMVMGSAVAGARAMTSSSSPGISLMQEGISYLAGCELPCLIVNVQRGGPGLGNISGSQADYFQAVKGGGHGDYRVLVLAPDSVQEMYDFSRDAFDLAEKYRNPVMILTDGISGQMMEPIEIRGRKSASADAAHLPKGADAGRLEKEWVLDGCKGRKPRLIRSLLMAEGALEKHNLKLLKKYEKIERNEVRFEEVMTGDAEILLVAYGIAARICKSVVKAARAAGLKVGLLRPITLWPFPSAAINDIALKAKKLLVVEMNNGQMVEDVKLSVNGKAPVEFLGCPGGGLVTAEGILQKLKEI